jgi:hypothetical protein
LFALVTCGRRSDVLEGEDLKIAEKAKKRIIYAQTFTWLGSIAIYYHFTCFGYFLINFPVSVIASTVTSYPLSWYLSGKRYRELAEVAKRTQLVSKIDQFRVPIKTREFLKSKYERLVLKDRDFLN